MNHSSTPAELLERRSRLLYNSAILSFLLSEFKAELENASILDNVEDACLATPREGMMAFLVQLDQFLRDRVKADPSLGYLDLVASLNQVQGIKTLQQQIAWLERLLDSTQVEIEMLNDALREFEQVDQ